MDQLVNMRDFTENYNQSVQRILKYKETRNVRLER